MVFEPCLLTSGAETTRAEMEALDHELSASTSSAASEGQSSSFNVIRGGVQFRRLTVQEIVRDEPQLGRKQARVALDRLWTSYCVANPVLLRPSMPSLKKISRINVAWRSHFFRFCRPLIRVLLSQE